MCAVFVIVVFVAATCPPSMLVAFFVCFSGVWKICYVLVVLWQLEITPIQSWLCCSAFPPNRPLLLINVTFCGDYFCFGVSYCPWRVVSAGCCYYCCDGHMWFQGSPGSGCHGWFPVQLRGSCAAVCNHQTCPDAHAWWSMTGEFPSDPWCCTDMSRVRLQMAQDWKCSKKSTPGNLNVVWVNGQRWKTFFRQFLPRSNADFLTKLHLILKCSWNVLKVMLLSMKYRGSAV